MIHAYTLQPCDFRPVMQSELDAAVLAPFSGVLLAAASMPRVPHPFVYTTCAGAEEPAIDPANLLHHRSVRKGASRKRAGGEVTTP